MKDVFEAYKPRQILFDDWLHVAGWLVKVYTITINKHFSSKEILKNVKKHIPIWLKATENSNLPTYRNAFAIVHEAREGVWILLSWWTGGEMVETKVFFSSFEAPQIITNSPYNTNALLCVWELEVFAHERASWIQNILLNSKEPDFQRYQLDVLTPSAI